MEMALISLVKECSPSLTSIFTIYSSFEKSISDTHKEHYAGALLLEETCNACFFPQQALDQTEPGKPQPFFVAFPYFEGKCLYCCQLG